MKAHASPALYAIEYLRGRLTAEALRELRTFGGLQAYPSRRKNPEIVDLSTGSMGLGAVQATFGALAARYVRRAFRRRATPARFIAIVGDAELDEGNVGRRCSRRPSRGSTTCSGSSTSTARASTASCPTRGAPAAGDWFKRAGWHVIELRWGRRLRPCFARPGGERLRARLEG